MSKSFPQQNERVHPGSMVGHSADPCKAWNQGLIFGFAVGLIPTVVVLIARIAS